jgi:hypothetical protein
MCKTFWLINIIDTYDYIALTKNDIDDTYYAELRDVLETIAI